MTLSEKMRVRLPILFLIVGIICTGVFVVWSRLSPSNYAAAIENGLKEIELAGDVDRLFQNAEHFISYYPRGGTPIWNSKVGLYQRYVLTMRFEIAFDFARRHPHPIAEPKFYLIEIDEIQHGSDGQTRITYTQNQHKFGRDEWNQLRRAGGKFEAIGIDLNDTEPIKDFDEVWTKS